MPALQGPIHKQPGGRFYLPLVRHIAQQEKISPQVLSRVPGTGKNNCTTKHDLLAYLQHCSEVDNPLLPAVAYMPIVPEDEVIQLDRMRQLIAEHMVASKHIAPHVTLFVEANVTDLVQWRNQHKEDFEQKTGAKLTYTLLFLQAIVQAIKDFPMINAFVAVDCIIKKKAINIGLAVALPNGNLIVPVIKHADQLSLVELAQKVQTLIHKACHQQLVPDELAEATYTTSNLGSFQNLMGMPIIPQMLFILSGQPMKITYGQGNPVILHRVYPFPPFQVEANLNLLTQLEAV